MLETYAAPAFVGTGPDAGRTNESGVPVFVGTIAVILVYFGAVLAWCYFVCRSYGGLRSCEVGWFTAKATCNG